MRKILTTTLFFIVSVFLFGQQSGITEQELIDKAETFYDQEIWAEALPLYAQLVSVYPENPNYNMRYGIASLKGDRKNSKQSVRYLTKAYQKLPENKELLYYLGLAYFQNQEFASAMHYFFESAELYAPGDPMTTKINDHINSCQRGLDLSHKNHLNEVIGKNEFQYENFHRAYPADRLEGSLIQKPQHFISAQETENGERSFVYISEPRGTVYFSGYADAQATQRDLFVVTIDDKGGWSDPRPLSEEVNTHLDEAFPVVTDQGKTLYFSSKGHNSMGGYDVFKSVLDERTGKFGVPENMGVGINSPLDDILYIPDESGSGAFFASNRESNNNSIDVYEVRLNQEVLAAEEPHFRGTTGVAATIATTPTETSDPATPQAGESKVLQSISVEEMEALAKKENPQNDGGEPRIPANEMVMNWELVIEEEDLATAPPPPIDPVKQVQHVRYVASQTSGMETDEALEIHLEPHPLRQVETVEYVRYENTMPEFDQDLRINLEADPVRQVERIQYAENQSSIREEDEALEIHLETLPEKQVQTIEFAVSESTMPAFDPDLQVHLEADPIQQVQKIRYVEAQSTIFDEDETLEILYEEEALHTVDPIDYALYDSFTLPEEESLAIRMEEEAHPVIEPVFAFSEGAIAVPDEQLEFKNMSSSDGAIEPDPSESERIEKGSISSLTASDGSLLAVPDIPIMPLDVATKGTDNQLIKKALSKPEKLSYEELLFAASIAENPDVQLQIYYNAFIRIDRDWRAYYNASVAARQSARPEQAEVYLYQARLISGEEIAEEIKKEFNPATK